MKTLLSFAVIVLCVFNTSINAQERYTVDGQEYTLNTEIDGPLTLLWNTINGEYRYFSKKGEAISELKNSKVNREYNEDYKETLRGQTQDFPTDLSKVKFTLPDLSKFFVAYNRSADPNFKHDTSSVQLNVRLGAFAGISNGVYTTNPTNALSVVAGIDVEIIENVRLKRHSAVMRFKQTFENSDTEFSSSQLSLNYRFKFVKTPKLDVFINTKFVTYTYSKRQLPITENGVVVGTRSATGGSFQAPVAFGLGADYALGNGYITFCYNDIVGIGLDNIDGNFPTDFTLGYKFNL